MSGQEKLLTLEPPYEAFSELRQELPRADITFRLYRSRLRGVKGFCQPYKGFSKHRFHRKRDQGRQTVPEQKNRLRGNLKVGMFANKVGVRSPA
jgi:hypothetical protein